MSDEKLNALISKLRDYSREAESGNAHKLYAEAADVLSAFKALEDDTNKENI